jgi:hypothetical protein
VAKVAAEPVIVERKRIKHHSTHQAEGKTLSARTVNNTKTIDKF